MDRLIVYEDDAGEHRWRRVAENGEVISSGEGFSRRQDAERGALRANPDFEAVEYEEADE